MTASVNFAAFSAAVFTVAVKDGTIRQVVWQDGEAEGQGMMQAAVDYLDDPASWQQKSIDIAGVVVTADNIDQFLADHPDALNP